MELRTMIICCYEAAMAEIKSVSPVPRAKGRGDGGLIQRLF
jgi:hypothetical protein